jgi:hypothetical protein
VAHPFRSAYLRAAVSHTVRGDASGTTIAALSIPRAQPFANRPPTPRRRQSSVYALPRGDLEYDRMILPLALIVWVLALLSAPGLEQLGTVAFPTSASTEVQPTIERGVALLHSFQYEEAAQAFENASQRDASCAMCHWGKAMTLYHPLFGEWPTAEAMATGRQEVARAQQLSATARERGYSTRRRRRLAPAAFRRTRANWPRFIDGFPTMAKPLRSMRYRS